MDIIVCPHCGTENSLDAKFCKNDGASLTDGFESTESLEAVRGRSALPARNTAQREDHRDSKTAEAPESVPFAWHSSHPIKPGARAIVFALMLVLIGCGVAGYLHFQNVFLDPAELRATLISSLTASGLGEISADISNDRIATLSGEVEDSKAAESALAIAASIKGIKSVLSELSVLPSLADVQALLANAMQEQQLSDVSVFVDQQRFATLSGHVSNEALITVALNAAAAIPGLKGLSSQIQVAYPVEIPDNSAGTSAAAGVMPAEPSSFVSPTARRQSVQTIISPRNPVADRRWLRE